MKTNAPDLCHCGCGGQAPVARWTNKRRGHVKGQPVKFIHNHHGRGKKRVETHADSVDRFLSYVPSRPEGRCWEWSGGRNSSGYGKFTIGNRTVGAHRTSYELFNGPIPDGLLVRHTCDNPPCVNPAHLLVGTTKDNSQDAKERGRLLRGAEHSTAKLTPEKVREIRARAGGGETQVSLAQRFNVSRAAIQWVLKGVSWAWIDEETENVR